MHCGGGGARWVAQQEAKQASLRACQLKPSRTLATLRANTCYACLPLQLKNKLASLTTLDRVATLIEALPYLQRFHGKTIVVKYGGAAMKDPTLKVRGALCNSRTRSSCHALAHCCLHTVLPTPPP